ncbi:MAG: hypothetical protein BAJATHORv1_170009 [Candidatus Thorarchaeota archaeon]|nr:MAG: hypothetical protein BAJATHORv1_170009 [Candidatus Thorarchaeota archaeon]
MRNDLHRHADAGHGSGHRSVGRVEGQLVAQPDRGGGLGDVDHQVIGAGTDDRHPRALGAQGRDADVLLAHSQDRPPARSVILPMGLPPEGVDGDLALGHRRLRLELDHLDEGGEGVLVWAGDGVAGSAVHAQEDRLSHPELVDPGRHLVPHQHVEVGGVTPGDDGETDAQGILQLPGDVDQQLGVLPGGQHPADAGQVGTDADQLDAGQLHHRPGRVEGVPGHHALAPVAGLDHEDHLVGHPAGLGGVGEGAHGLHLGVEADLGQLDHSAGLADTGQAEEHHIDVDAGPAHALDVAQLGVGQGLHAAGEYGVGDVGVAAAGLGHADHVDPVVGGQRYEGPGVLADLVALDSKSHVVLLHRWDRKGTARRAPTLLNGTATPSSQHLRSRQPTGAERSARRLEYRSRFAARDCLVENLAHELLRPLLFRIAENLLRGSLLDDASLVQEDHTVGRCPSEAHLVGDDDHGHPLLGQVEHHVEHLLDHLRVEGRRRLVEEHDHGVHR